jgi:putative restriction endonuclease
MDLIAAGLIKENFIEPNYDLAETFQQYWTRIMPLGTKRNMALPFYHLNSEGFWHLVPKQGMRINSRVTTSVTRLRQHYAGARLDDELFLFLRNSETKEILRAILVDTYFAHEIRSILREQGIINYEAYQYAEKLLAAEATLNNYGKEKNQNDRKKKVRDQGFRKAIVRIYEHRCALCGIRMLTPDGHTVVDAAHIKPWSESYDDRPTNGLSLCKLCHWSFDEGLIGVNDQYKVMISSAVRTEQNMPGHMMALAERPIICEVSRHPLHF